MKVSPFRRVMGWLMLATVVSGFLRPIRDAEACDVCAVYTATEFRDSRKGLRLGIAEQFTNYGTFLKDGKEAPNLADQFLRSSTTQFYLAYNFTPDFSAQLTLPLVSRWFRRIEEGRTKNGNITGLGDLTLLGRWRAYSHVDTRQVLRVSLLAGLKLPSGDSDELRDDTSHSDLASPSHGGEDHGDGKPNAVGGDLLALGSGSVDGILGAQVFWSQDRWYLSMIGQYAIRGTGSFDYRFANDLFWFVGPGVFLLAEHGYTLAAQAVVSGETKGEDTHEGDTVRGSGRTNVFAGPALLFSWGSNLIAELAGDVPFVTHASGTTLAPDYRIRAAFSWQF